MIPGLYQDSVTVYRRTSTGRDSLNNPIYGTPVSGVGWFKIFTNIGVRLAFSDKLIDFSEQGERVIPQGTMYAPPSYIIRQEDRVLTADNILYVVVGVRTGYLFNRVVDHYEYTLALP